MIVVMMIVMIMIVMMMIVIVMIRIILMVIVMIMIIMTKTGRIKGDAETQMELAIWRSFCGWFTF